MVGYPNIALQGNTNEGLYTLRTADASFAYSVYERALDIGVQGDVAAIGDGTYQVQLFGEEEECDAALSLALAGEAVT